MNLKTQEITISSLVNLKLMNSTDIFGCYSFLYPNLFLYELDGENKYLIGYITKDQNNIQTLNLFVIGLISTPKKKNITIDSIKIYNEFYYNDDFYDSKLSCIQTKSGNIIITYKTKNFIGDLIFDNNLIFIRNETQYEVLEPYSFFKRIFMGREVSLLSYIAEKTYLLDCSFQNRKSLFAHPQELMNNKHVMNIGQFVSKIEFDEFYSEYFADGIALSETKVIFLSFTPNYRFISIYLVYFYNDYTRFILTIFE